MFLIAAVLGCAVVLLVGILFRRAAAKRAMTSAPWPTPCPRR